MPIRAEAKRILLAGMLRRRWTVNGKGRTLSGNRCLKWNGIWPRFAR